MHILDISDIFYCIMSKKERTHRKPKLSKQLCTIYWNEALKQRQCQNWFGKFRSDFSLKNVQ